MGVPWLYYPLMLHMYRDPGECVLTPEQCAYMSYTWRNWYIADYVYARGTVYFFLITIFLCTGGFLALKHTPLGIRTRAWWQKLVAIFRFAAYRRYEVFGRWQTPTVGVMFLLAVGFLFFTAMTLGPRPYYWPTTAAFGDSPPLATRSGWLALGATPFIILFAAKANVIATLSGVSHEKLMVFHAWLAWAVLVLALLHTFPFIVYNYKEGMMTMQWTTNFSYWTGVAAIVPQAYLTFMSVPWIRNACYEFFKATHYFMAIVFMVFFFIHCGFTLSSADYFIVAGVLYALSWCYSQMKTYFDHGFHNRATITRLSPRCLRVDIPVGPLTLWRPGQHMFLRFLTLGTHHALTAHPFTICSLPDHDRLVGAPRSVMTFYVKPRGGFTGRLAAIAAARGAGGAVATLPVLMEGAYGGLHGKPLTAYDRALVVACGSGAGFSLPFAMEWISAAATAAAARDFAAAVGGSGGEKGVKEVVAAPKAPRKMTIVIVTRDTRILQWYEAALSEFLESQNLEMPEGALEIKVYQTSETDDPEDTESDAEAGRRTPPSSSEDDEKVEPLASSSSTSSSQKTPATSLGFKTFTGRPDLAAVVRDFTLEETGSVGMAVCGPSSVLAAVRDEAAAAEMRILKSGPGAKEVYLYSEMFGW